MRIVILIPAHNEAKAIGDLVRKIITLGYDVIVIDDGSVDDTALLAQTQGAKVVSTLKKSGKGNALRLGFASALKEDYEAVITLDGDGQHEPSDIVHFVECYQKSHADIVNGDRMHNPTGMPALRRMTNGFMSWMISLICHQEISDTQCGFRLITTKVLKAIELHCNDFEIETEILIRASKKGFRIASVGIQSIYRDEVSKINPLRDTLRFISYISKDLQTMMNNDFLFKALFISLTIHTIVVCSSYWMKMPELKRARDKRVEISYQPPSPKHLDIRQHSIKPAQKLDLQNSPLASNDTIGVKLSKVGQGPTKDMTMFERKPAQMTSEQANHVTVTPITSEKINSPVYTSYQDRIRESIKERVYANYSRLERGNVYLTFIIASDGSLKAYQIISEKTKATQNLKYISTKSLQEAHFPPFLKGMTLPEYTFNIEIEYQVAD